ncbi:MAG TPA: hypothetical protein DCS07_12255 [Bdellovibrionales bacterium]|nr:MAG: hypothetical protein A2X97_04205 [Bdellovibrionales bacterium GWA1_52_35]OFZ44145.1 MAG: hypothetical protein A2070_07260 [Bdellovibrionales bacterium GWC1_52_8]HAR43382.1 hypothetical protein [Bdellovibrionales bacterium]HCM38363.1 hypothetical protein [Bdellovibrionales bacterium]
MLRLGVLLFLCLIPAQASCSGDVHWDLTELAHFFEFHGMTELDRSRAGNLPFLELDQVFSSDDLSRSVYVKQWPANAPLPAGFQFHIPRSASDSPSGDYTLFRPGRDGAINILYFSGYSQLEITRLASLLKRFHLVETTRRTITDWLITPAFAADCPYCDGRAAPVLNRSNTQSLEQALLGANRSSLAQTIQFAWPCLDGALRGAGRGAFGGIIMAADLIKNPAAFWKGVKGGVQTIYRLMTDFQNEAARIHQGFLLLPPEQKARIICGFVSQIGTQTLVAVLTGGTAIAFIIKKFIQYLKSTEIYRKISSMITAVPVAVTRDPVTGASRFRDWAEHHPRELWKSSLNPEVKQALKDFGKRKLPSGEVYGRAIRQIKIENLSPKKIDVTLKNRGFHRINTVVRDFKTKAPVLGPNGRPITMVVYAHPDGSTVRVKPIGDATNPFRSQPHFSKSVRYPPDAPIDDFAREAFKVDAHGNAIPKAAMDMELPYSPKTAAGKHFLDAWANDAHSNLNFTTP